jgi:thioesterase domain-containing protein
MAAKKPKIQAILPLSYLQRALLFHSLAETQDQGIIQVACQLEGTLNREAFSRSWELVTERHPALRSSIHWENIKEPVQIIRPAASLCLTFKNLNGEPELGQQSTIEDYKATDAATKFELTKAPVNRLALFQTDATKYELVWTSHHLLLDGWSAGVVLRDVFKYYEAEISGVPSQANTLPDHRQYVSWLKSRDRTAAAGWWKEQFDGFTMPTLLGTGAAAGATLETKEQYLTEEAFLPITEALREHRLTLNTVAQGLWGLLLGRLFGRDDVLFGTTVSGRTPDIPRHDEMAGLFTNAVPVRICIEDDKPVSEWLQELQTVNLEGVEHNFANLGEVTEWSGIAPNALRFDHLLLVQNYPWSDLAGGGVSVSDFKGDLTSTQPLVVMLRPQEGLTLSLRYDSVQLPETVIDWLLKEYTSLLLALPGVLNNKIEEVQGGLSVAPAIASFEFAPEERSMENYTVANSATELALTKIWENLLSLSPIGVTDDFFYSGGTSMLAIRLFTRIGDAFEKKLPPITILQNRTIRELARLIDGDSVPAWTTIVPLKASGSKPAIFCFHAGMGHVFYYHPFSRLVDVDRPVYAIQPNGLDGEEKVHGSIKEMAAHYLKEIRKVQPEGPYIFLAYCFSTAVCVELAHLLRAEGLPAPILLVVDSAPLPRELDQVIEFRQKKKGLRWLAGRLYRREFRQLKNGLQLEYAPDFMLPQELREERNVNTIRDQFVPLYENYLWRNINCEVFLIRSTEFMGIASRKWHLETWNRLSGQQLKTMVVEAIHDDFFEEPAVGRLAEAIEEYLNERG